MKKIEENLKKLNAVFVKEIQETDVYFNARSSTVKLSSSIEGDFLYIFQHKPELKEFNFSKEEVKDYELLKETLERNLGIKLEVKKTRKEFQVNGKTVLINLIPRLGNYLILWGEKEDKEELMDLLKKLGLSETDLESKPFDELILLKRKSN